MSQDFFEGEFRIVNPRGLHARAATKLVQLAGRFSSEVLVIGADGEAANAKSVMGVLLLCGSAGTTLRFEARGPDAEAAVQAIGELVRDGFGELGG